MPRRRDVPLMPCSCKHDLTRLGRKACCQRQRGRTKPAHSQHGDIGAGIAPKDNRLEFMSIEGHGRALVITQRLVGGDHKLGPPNKSARQGALSAADLDNGLRNTFHKPRQARGELLQRLCLFGHAHSSFFIFLRNVPQPACIVYWSDG